MGPTDPDHAFLALTPDEMLDAVESRGIVCDGRFLVLNSYENRVYRVGVEEGPPIVAKFYRPGRWSDEGILEEHHFTQALEHEEIPVVAPLITELSQTLHHAGPFRFSLYPYRGGRSMEPDNPHHLEMLGRFIGRIHAVGALASFCHRPTIEVESFVRAPGEYLQVHGYIPAHLESRWVARVDQLADLSAEALIRVSNLAQIRLHGDMHLGNVLWTDQGPHIVDFDDARTGPAIQDLWMFLSGEGEYLAARLQDLLRGYKQFFDFNTAEIRLVEVMRSLRMVYHAGWLASRWRDPAFPLAFPWFDTGRYWEQLMGDVESQVEKVQVSLRG